MTPGWKCKFLPFFRRDAMTCIEVNDRGCHLLPFKERSNFVQLALSLKERLQKKKINHHNSDMFSFVTSNLTHQKRNRGKLVYWQEERVSRLLLVGLPAFKNLHTVSAKCGVKRVYVQILSV